MHVRVYKIMTPNLTEWQLCMTQDLEDNAFKTRRKFLAKKNSEAFRLSEPDLVSGLSGFDQDNFDQDKTFLGGVSNLKGMRIFSHPSWKKKEDS